MSKKCKKESGLAIAKDSKRVAAGCRNNDESETMLTAVIGASNVARWLQIKSIVTACQSNEVFVTLLLDLAAKYLIKNNKCINNLDIHGNEGNKTISTIRKESTICRKSKKKEHKHKKRKQNISIPVNESIGSDGEQLVDRLPKVLPDCTKIEDADDTKTNEEEKIAAIPQAPQVVKPSLMVNISNELFVPLQSKTKLSKVKKLSIDDECNQDATESSPHQKVGEKSKRIKVKEILEHDIRKAPELVQQEQPAIIASSGSTKTICGPDNLAKSCATCESEHLNDSCPLTCPKIIVYDAITMQQWQDAQDSELKLDEIENSADSNSNSSYACLSLPSGLKLDDAGTPAGLTVIVDEDVAEFTQYGPLIAPIVKEVDVPEDCNMRYMYEIVKSETERLYFNSENEEESNWMRFLRPAPTRDVRNLLVVPRDDQLFFVTVKNVNKGDELLYWQDDVVSSNKKKMEKTTCGGCNMTFQHPLYYRIHCSVFHDVRYSLTIRKYHCKICGAAVLGKENIMKHASELHNGQGAYQCQFCKKFFLRLNYLEMHRTYGCSANPQRARPLCDFCGRKFCQPQKLKVHIKRMHSDMSEVLKEFQCKNCLKILGSRAALQRHLKEVHKKQVDGACACSKCGKLFQNKSNLKIHMLTHSGIKPFRCNQTICQAAFTTKQCLQFHYKKVHSFTEDMMPKIERSVDYTFEAYSGADDELMDFPTDKKTDSVLLAESDKKDSNTSDQEDNVLDDNKFIDNPPALRSPTPLHHNEHSSNSATSPPTLEAYAPNMKILSKGSKKWIGEQHQDVYGLETRKCNDEEKDQQLHFDEIPKISSNLGFNRHESNASLLVEAALDSVCSEPNIDIDVSTTPNCTDTLVNNLYTLSHSDSLGDVTYSQSVDVTDSRDINLISPSVNEQISVTDDINDELRHTQTMGIDYSSFHQEDFSPGNSPRNNFRDYISSSPQNLQSQGHGYEKAISPGVASPPRYDFGSNVNPESDDSNGIGVQNLSLHGDKFADATRDGIQLDLSIYKSHYSFDPNFLRKDPRGKFEIIDSVQIDNRKNSYIIDNEDTNKFSLNGNVDNDNLDSELKDFEGMDDGKSDKDGDLDLSMRSNVPDLRSKFDLDLDLRKPYEVDGELRRNVYDSSLDDFRMKNYDLDNLDALRSNLERKTYESLIEDFRADRNFEPLVLNPSELQGLDMSARGYHNYPNLNRYHHLYSEVDRPSVDLRLNYSPPPSYTHPDILRVSLDLAPPGRHSVDLSLRSQIANSRLLSEHSLQTSRLGLDQSRLLSSELTAPRHIAPDSRLISDMSNRILSDHTTNRLLSNDQLTSNRLIGNEQRILQDDSRLIDQPRLLDQNRLLAPANGSMSPVSYSGYSVSPSPYHPTALPPRPHVTSPNPTAYHHYSAYY